MKAKLITFLLAMLTVVSIVYGYIQRQDAQFQRDQVNEMHREVVRMRNESEAARAEAAKLRNMAMAAQQEAEKQMQLAEEALQNCKKKK